MIGTQCISSGAFMSAITIGRIAPPSTTRGYRPTRVTASSNSGRSMNCNSLNQQIVVSSERK
jgi:hypothetical protein